MPLLSPSGPAAAPIFKSGAGHFMAVIAACFAVLLGVSSAKAQTMSVGNLVFFDANSNGYYDGGEGVGDVSVELWRATGDPQAPYVMEGSLQTQPSGYYLFQGLTSGTYYLHIPSTEFVGPLDKASPLPMAQSTGDDNAGQDGQYTFDASITGVSTAEFIVEPGFGPTSGEGETGFQSTLDDAEDTNVDLTLDFGFYKPVGLGNVVFADMNGNGHADSNEGVPGVVVQLFLSGDDPQTAQPITDIVTSSEGTFWISGLFPGSYKLHVPASQFAAGGPLQGALSVAGVGGPGDDDGALNGDDGIDQAAPATTGITSGVVTLAAGTEPTLGTGETGLAAGDDDPTDSDNDLTIDFGFVFPADKVAVGNMVFFDYDHSLVYDDGEGVPGVVLKLFTTGQNPQTDTPVASTVSQSDGSYLFANLDPGSYFIHIPKSEFGPGKPLFSGLSVTTTAVDDDNLGEDGVDVPYPELTGVSSADFSLALGGAPTDGTTETGYAADSDNFRDADVDLTRDFGFVHRANNPLAVGNAVFDDLDHDGRFDAGEQGIGDVLVQLFHEGDDPFAVAPVASMHTGSAGEYMFSGLTPGRYFVFIPPAEFLTVRPLVGLLSSPGSGGDDSIDDDNNENGIDSQTPKITGIRSAVFELTENLEWPETGFQPNMDVADDNNGDLTIDFGFGVDCPVISILPTLVPGATRNESYSATFTLTGSSGQVTWTISGGTLPPGLSLSTGGALTGTPTQTGTYAFSLQAQTEEMCVANADYSLTVQPPFIMGVGNVIFHDANGNGHFDAGEGINNVLLKLFHEGDDPLTASSVAETNSSLFGLWSFSNLQPGSYFVHIPSDQFQGAAPLVNKVSVPGVAADNGSDDGVDENGFDAPNPASTGLNSIVFTLSESDEPVDGGTESGVGATDDNASDANFDATIDLGFIASPAVSVGLGNLVFRDANNSGHFEEGEGVDGVTVQLFLSTDVPLSATPLRTTTTSGGGRYNFNALAPGSYKVFVPPTQFALGAPLYGTISMIGAGGDGAVDDDVDENGINSGLPATDGVVSTVVALALGTEPENSSMESGASNFTDDAGDANVDLTVDLGFVRDCSPLTLLPATAPAGLQAVGYSVQFVTSGGVGPYTYSLASGALPQGLSLDSAGLLSGTPTSYGSYGFDVQATDNFGCFVILSYTLSIAPPPLAVGNLIYFDGNGNGHADAGEGVDGVTVMVYTFNQTPGVDPAIGQTTTSGGGFWLVDNLAPGQYVAHVPAAMFAQGAPLWKLKSAAGVLNFGDDDAGEDGADSLEPENVGVTSDTFELLPSASPTGGNESGLAGGSDDARDGDIDLTRDLGFVDVTPMPATFAAWETQNGVTSGPEGNGDNDALSNLMEYLFGEDPNSGGRPTNTPFAINENQATGQFSITLRRRHGGSNDLATTVQLRSGLGTPGGWTSTSMQPTSTSNGDGTETLTYPNIDADTALGGSTTGFVRLLVSLDADHNGTPELTETSHILGWQKRSLPVQHSTYGIPFVAPAVFTGTVGGVAGDVLDMSGSAGGLSILGSLVAGFDYYVEVVGGDNEGHRFDVDEAATTETAIALLPANARSTQSSVPLTLAGDRIALRRYWRLVDIFPLTDYHPGANNNVADQIILWNSATSTYSTMWLANSPGGRIWLKANDASLTVQNNLVLAPADGYFARPRTAVSAAASGEVRTWKFACPLKPGLNFVGNPFPVAQSPGDRQMTFANGFTGGNSNTADKFNFWNGDTTSNATYSVHYLFRNAGGTIEMWLRSGDASGSDQTNVKLFGIGTAVFVNSKVGKLDWVLPVTWSN